MVQDQDVQAAQRQERQVTPPHDLYLGESMQYELLQAGQRSSPAAVVHADGHVFKIGAVGDAEPLQRLHVRPERPGRQPDAAQALASGQVQTASGGAELRRCGEPPERLYCLKGEVQRPQLPQALLLVEVGAAAGRIPVRVAGVHVQRSQL